MLFRFLRRLANRRKDPVRHALRLLVRTPDDNGSPLEVLSEDVSEKGIRLRFSGRGIADVSGTQEQIPLEIFLEEAVPPVKVKARLVWAYTAPDGDTVSGWEFVSLKGRALRRFRSFVDRIPHAEKAGSNGSHGC